MEVQINENSLIKIFVDIDDFCQNFKKWQANTADKQVTKWTSGLFRSEAMTILVYYHNSGYKCFQYYGEITSFLFSSANFADNNQEVLKYLFKDHKGFCFGDKGYLTKLFEEFYSNGLKIVTKIRKNMKNKLMPIQEKYDLMKRGVIESVNDILMTVCDIEHTRHRSPINAMTHMISALISYNYLDSLSLIHI